MTAFSVVINTCDRAPSLRTLLYALNQQTYTDFEVVVVLGPSSDDSMQVIAEFDQRLTLIHCHDFNLSMSRNLGIEAASGEIIAFIDDDAVPCPTWLEQLAHFFSAPAVAGAGGKVLLVTPDHSEVQFRYGQFSLLGEDRDVRAAPDDEILAETPPECWYPRLMGTNMAYRRQALLEVGGFDERFAYLFEEPDLAIRMANQGHNIVQTDLAVVYHAPVSSLNRVAFTPIINWYASMRGILYFSLKNAVPKIGLPATLARCVRHVLFYFKSLYYQYRDGAIPPEIFPSALRQLVRGAVWGFSVGLFGSRRTRKKKFARAGANTRPSLLPFLSPTSHRFPAISPHPPLAQGAVSAMKKEPLHICLLSYHYPPQGTEGVARLTQMMARGMAELGNDTHVITNGPSERTTVVNGVYVHEVPPADDRYASIFRGGRPRTAACLRHSHAAYACASSLKTNHGIQIVDSPLWQFEGLVMAQSGEIPVVTRLVTSNRQLAKLEGYQRPETDLMGDLEAQLLRLSQGLVPLTQSVQQTYRNLYGSDVTQQPQCVIRAGVVPLPEAQVTPLSGQSKPDPVILFVGRLEKRKGILTLFEAIPEVLDRFPRARFWLAGRDNSENDGFASRRYPSYVHYFRKEYRAYADNVSFLGYVADDQLGTLYSACDLFVAPSLFESFGLVFLEAMNYARPTIGCSAGGPSEIIAHGETGLLVDPANSEALAQAIIDLIQDADRRRQMGIAGRQRLCDNFHYLDAARQYTSFYEEILN